MNAGIVDTRGARCALGRGEAVVLPNPAPLTFVVAATSPQAVNAAKGRPLDQAVALWTHGVRALTALDGALDLHGRTVSVAGRLLSEERVTLLVPLRSTAHPPHWLRPASRDGWALLFGARWAPLSPVLAGAPILYVSSANRTGHPPAASVAEAIAMFAATPVLGAVVPDCAAERGRGAPRRATTTLRLHPDGRLELHRRGAQDLVHPDPEEYLDRIRAAYCSENGPEPFSGLSPRRRRSPRRGSSPPPG
ncbi:hypothetical protein [Nocardiopsis ansamitocini]|uniref:YrdC-like domain-containing protein n=1 Tax=Nocardiopsis ansamitocini TaxID=1670832 RepID=A0A9W6P8I1_9ACTN|nr:hypothetical protein [Nocardiopsis ansamitocini]GLU49525.1 hypothetical protein Nans01_38760 [Nocardiopsis ansamitocini]